MTFICGSLNAVTSGGRPARATRTRSGAWPKFGSRADPSIPLRIFGFAAVGAHSG